MCPNDFENLFKEPKTSLNPLLILLSFSYVNIELYVSLGSAVFPEVTLYYTWTCDRGRKWTVSFARIWGFDWIGKRREIRRWRKFVRVRRSVGLTLWRSLTFLLKTGSFLFNPFEINEFPCYIKRKSEVKMFPVKIIFKTDYIRM